MSEDDLEPISDASGQTEAYYDDRDVPEVLMESTLDEVPRRPALIVETTATIAEVIRQMNDSHRGCALVVRGDRLVGIFTERDVLKRVAGAALDIHTTPVAEVMTADPETLPEKATTVPFALNRMSVEGYRHIPIVDDHGRPVAVIAMRDVIQWLLQLFPEHVLNIPPRPSWPATPGGA